MLRATNKVLFPLICSCIAIGINICLNYVLIFGKFGALAMGVAGATCATLVARCIELTLILGMYMERDFTGLRTQRDVCLVKSFYFPLY